MIALFLSLLIVIAIALLLWLSAIDLKIGLLPNPLVLALALCGVGFHLSAPFFYLGVVDMMLGALIGGGILLLIRYIANWILKTDSLGLGDVKLMAAAGLWLGDYFITVALIVGAFAGLLHGLGYAFYIWRRKGAWPDMAQLSIPAGPGFCFGIVVAGGLLFADLPDQILKTLGV